LRLSSGRSAHRGGEQLEECVDFGAGDDQRREKAKHVGGRSRQQAVRKQLRNTSKACVGLRSGRVRIDFGLIAAVEFAPEPERSPTHAFEVFRNCLRTACWRDRPPTCLPSPRADHHPPEIGRTLRVARRRDARYALKLRRQGRPRI